MVLIRDYWHCHYRHLIGSSQTTTTTRGQEVALIRLLTLSLSASFWLQPDYYYYYYYRSRSGLDQTTDIVIIGILLAPARLLLLLLLLLLLEVKKWPRSDYWHCHYRHLTGPSQNIGAKAKCLFRWECHVRIAFRFGNLYDVTNSLTEIPEVGVQLSRAAVNAALVFMTVCTGVGKRLQTWPLHPTLGEPQEVRLPTTPTPSLMQKKKKDQINTA